MISLTSLSVRDRDWPGGGIVIYHIDEAADRQSKRGAFRTPTTTVNSTLQNRVSWSPELP